MYTNLRSLWIPWVISLKSHFFETRERRWGMLSITTTCSEIRFHQRLDSENCPEHQFWLLPKILATGCPENFLDPSLNLDSRWHQASASIPRMGIQNQANSLEQSIQDKARRPKMEGPHWHGPFLFYCSVQEYIIYSRETIQQGKLNINCIKISIPLKRVDNLPHRFTLDLSFCVPVATQEPPTLHSWPHGHQCKTVCWWW